MRILWGSLNCASKAKVQIWDTLAKPKGRKIPLKTHRENLITWYACGPTVYDSAHIGHASSYVRLDIIRRILERQHYTVLQVMGITDIDDKIITRSNQEGVPWDALTRKYEIEFAKELQCLNIKPPFTRARVTRFIPHIIQFVKTLLSNGFAYTTPDGSVYFNTDHYELYGIFSSSVDDSQGQEVSSVTKYKKNKKDFALWKASKPDEPFWLSPWGQGRPGWHIECSVIASHYFGRALDIHSGGSDLMFPHHENEEAQCCAHFGLTKWVTHWIHTGHLLMKEGGPKMSKSLGNTLTISEFLKNDSPNSLRMLCLIHNHRSHLFYSPQSLQNAKSILKRFQTFLADCIAIVEGNKRVTSHPAHNERLWSKLAVIKIETENALCDDFDTATAVNVLNDFVSDFNRTIQVVTSAQDITDSMDYELILAAQSFVNEFFLSMGFQMEDYIQVSESSSTQLLQPVLQEFIDFRQSVRSFGLAMDEVDKAKRKELIKERKQLTDACDQVRQNLVNYGVEVKDHGKSSSWTITET